MTGIQSGGTSHKNYLQNAEAIGAGLITAYGVSAAGNKLMKQVAKKLHAQNEGVDMNEIRIKLNDAVKSTGKDIKIIDFSGYPPKPDDEFKTGIKQLNNDYTRRLMSSKNIGEFWNTTKSYFKKFAVKSLLQQVKTGCNAFHVTGTNKILIKTESIGLAGFHEIGHALNHYSKFWKPLQYLRCLPLYAPVGILAVSLLKRPKEKGEPEKNKFDKATDFIKNNGAKLALALSLPVIAEEAAASVKGARLAKKLCSPENYQKVLKLQTAGLATYGILAAATSLSIFAANKIRNAISKPE